MRSQGKSLSLICGALTWLRDHKGKEFEEGLNWAPDGMPCVHSIAETETDPA